ncbi:MAG: thiamine ABC transporter substrate-binding protein [Alphaproteobacteria bacterium]|nr:thiamine ABC transporter substrate-binding protein [Alphaproteobacteria bacterium]NCQ66468.1 thiamine ABC transporter substrate-binding protein [Alphaproteobacteria bacterium]
MTFFFWGLLGDLFSAFFHRPRLCHRLVNSDRQPIKLRDSLLPFYGRSLKLHRQEFKSFFRPFLLALFSITVLILSSLGTSLKADAPEKPLVVYIHETLYVTQKEALVKHCSFPLILKPFSGSDLVGKILLEGKHLKADVVVGLEGERMNDPRIASLAESLPPALFQKLTLPFSWKNKNFLPLSYAYLAFLYEEEALQPAQETLGDFLKSLPPKSLVVPDPRTSMVGRGALSWVAPSDYEMLHEKTLTYPKGWSGAFSLFNRGRAKVMLSYTTSILYHQANGQPFVRWASFKKTAHPLQVMTAFVSRKISPHPRAILFLEVLLSKAAQQGVIDNYAYPVIKISLPETYEKCRPQDAFLLEGGEIKEAENLRKWMAAGYKK